MGKISIEDKIEQEIKELFTNKDFVSDIEDFRKRISNAHLKIGEACEEEHFKIDESFSDETEVLRKKYNISSLGQVYFQIFLFTGKFDTEDKYNLISQFHLNPGLYLGGPSVENDYLSIQIHRYTTIDDIKKAWPRIQTHFKNTPAKKIRFKIKKNIDRDLEIVKLKQEGKTSKEITRIINDKYPNAVITYDYVSKIIKRAKNKDT